MKIKIMVVDDDPAVLDLLKAMLEAKGCEVEGVLDSREAAQRLHEEKVDGLFVDVLMPHLDGFAVTRAARQSKLNRHVPIVMLTVLDDVETMRKGFEAGISFFLGKPFTRERVDNLYGAARGPMLREKQRYIRLPYCVTVDCRWGPYDQGHFKSTSRDISEGGMLISPSGGLEVGCDLEMNFSLPDTKDPLKVGARVVRAVPPNSVGVMFTNLALQDREAIMRYVAARMRD